MGGTGNRNTAEKHFLNALGLHTGQSNRIHLPPSTLEAIIDKDAQNPKSLSVQNVDEYTSGAAASGDVERSSIAQDIDAKGDTTWELYTSRKYGMVVGLGIKSVVFYGDGWVEDDIVDYITDIILSEL